MSRDYQGKRIVLWPINIDSTRSRKEGRKISKEYAVPHPTVEEIYKVAKELNLDPIIEDKPYPRAWWEQRKRISILKTKPKTQLLRELAAKIKEKRGKSK